MLRPRTALVALALCALPVVALTGCASSSSPSTGSSSSSGSKSSGSGSSTSTVTRPKDMCTLITPAQVAAIVGGDAGDTYSKDGTCVYSPEDLDLTLTPANIDWAESISIDKIQYKLTTVSGIGDQAVEAPNFIQVRKGNVIFTINQPDADGNTSASYRALAKIVVGNLK
jgi:hypothetical protein